MAETITMPKIAMGQTEGQVMEWLAEPGSWVEKGQMVMVIETEKVTYEIESPAAGYLLPQVALGDVVPVGTAVALLAQSEAELAQMQPAPAAETATPAQTNGRQKPRKIRISPVARKKARAHGLDITQITGSGPNGRIINKDIERALAKRETAVPAPAWSGETIEGVRVKAAIPLRGMRKAIAEHMRYSLSIAPQVSTSCELDMTEIIRLRQKLLQKEEEIGVRISFNDIFIMVMAKAIRHVPIVNASLVGDEIKIWEDINIANAIAVEIGPYETGLIAPVIHNADQKSLAEIGRLNRELAQKARTGKLTPADTSGGTITLSDVGPIAPAWTISTPIINQPQAFIVQPGKIGEKPVARDGQIVIRPIMPLSITFDHRVMDGAPVTRFIGRVMELVENPEYLHL